MERNEALNEIKNGLDIFQTEMEGRTSKEQTIEDSFYAIETIAGAHAAHYFQDGEIKQKLENLRSKRYVLQQKIDEDCWTLKKLTDELGKLRKQTEKNQKELLIYKMGVLREEIRKISEEIKNKEESVKKDLILNGSKTIVDHVKGLVEFFTDFENPIIKGIEFASLAIGSWDNFNGLTEAIDMTKINQLEDELKHREEELKKDEDRLRKMKHSS